VHVYSVNAQMTSNGGKNKEVRYELQASSVTNVVTMFGHLLCVITVHNHGQMESTCFIHFLLSSAVPNKIDMFFENFVVMVCARFITSFLSV